MHSFILWSKVSRDRPEEKGKFTHKNQADSFPSTGRRGMQNLSAVNIIFWNHFFPDSYKEKEV